MEPKTVQERQQDLCLVDVREDDEWAAGHIDGAMHIPLGELNERMGDIDKNAHVITVCRSGGRAGQATEQLVSAGYKAETMDGGMKAWDSAGLTFNADDGTPGSVA